MNRIANITYIVFGSLLAIVFLYSISTPAKPAMMPEATAIQIAQRQQAKERIETAELIPVEQINTEPFEQINAEAEQQPAGQYESVAAYFKDAYPNPLSHRFNERRFERDVSSSQRKRIIQRDGGCCLVCGSTHALEVDHRVALMNNGGNEDANLGTLCDECHKIKTRLDWKIKKQRRKRGERH